MAEQTFRSPGFFENEIDLAARDVTPQGVPAGIIGTAEKGPAFVPVTMGSFSDFVTRFGSLDPERFGPYAVREWFKSRTSLTYMRVLGAGANSSVTDINNTKNFGIVRNAGFVISGTVAAKPPNARDEEHAVQFITARHVLANTDGGEMFGFPVFTDNDSFVEEEADKVNLVRGVLFTTTGSRFELLPNSAVGAQAIDAIDPAVLNAAPATTNLRFVVPAAAGGEGNNGGLIDVEFSVANELPGESANKIQIHQRVANNGVNLANDATGNAELQDRIINAINGVADANVQVASNAGNGHNTGVQGVRAEKGTGFKVSLIADGGNISTQSGWGSESNAITVKKTTGAAILVASSVTGDDPPKLKQTGQNATWVYNQKKVNTTQPTDFLNSANSKYKNAQTYFKLVLSTSAGEAFGKDEGHAGVRILTASLEPTDPFYIGRVLNTDPHAFYHERHLLYLDFPVESEIAKVDATPAAIGLLSGSSNKPIDINPKSYRSTSPATFMELFGRFDTRYKTPKTPNILSQPYGSKEFDLFHFETVSDGEWGNSKFKISIANIRASSDPRNSYGTFEVQLRAFDDTDKAPQILERFPECTLDPDDERFVAKQIGDMRARFNHDAENESERRIIVKGKYPNRSHRFRIVMNQAVEDRLVPSDALPFGFRGMEVLRTTDSLTDKIDSLLLFPDGTKAGVDGGDGGANKPRIDADNLLTPAISNAHFHKAAIIPPLPFRFKVTKDAVENVGAGSGADLPAHPGGDNDKTADRYVGRPGKDERVDPKFYWGIKTTRVPISASLPAGEVTDSILRSNDSRDPNYLVNAYTKMHGIGQLGTLVTGSAADEFNNNKFTLARVALSHRLSASIGAHSDATNNRLEKILTGTARSAMLDAVYLRNADPSSYDYTVSDRFRDSRITMATLVHSSSTIFNRFSEYNKFTTVFHGGFDGTNILSHDSYYMTDRASSDDIGGHALNVPGGDCYQGLAHLVAGEGGRNNIVKSIETGVRIMTDPKTVRINLLAIPGMRDTSITQNALEKVKDYGLAMYVMDIRNYDQDITRLYDNSIKKPDVRVTAEQFDGEAVDNNYGAVYFPDVFIQDDANNRPVRVPASVAAFSALGFNDRVGFPWFAPAGFNRGSLAAVTNVHTRLSSADRDELYDVRINPIAVFPTGRFVIFGQKTLQQARSALDRVNVRRLLLEVKRRVSSAARKLLFEANDAQTRARFVGEVAPQLATIQAQAGVERFSIVCDGTNNNEVDEQENRMNGRIVIVPTLAVEFIALDFIVTNSGVSFE